MSDRFLLKEGFLDGVVIILVVVFSDPERIEANMAPLVEVVTIGQDLPLSNTEQNIMVIILSLLLIFLLFSSIVPFVFLSLRNAKSEYDDLRSSW